MRKLKNLFKCILVFLLIILEIFISVPMKSVMADTNVDKFESDSEKYLINKGLPTDYIDSLSEEDKVYLYEANKAHDDIPLETIEEFLKKISVPDNIIQKLTYGQKITIYETLHNENEDFVFKSYQSQIVKMPNIQNTKGFSIKSAIPTSWLELSVVAIYPTNNRNWFAFYPSFNWIGNVTDINTDAFAFALNSAYWEPVSTDTTILSLYFGDTLINTFTPTESSFVANGYQLSGPHDVRLNYNATCFYKARYATQTQYNWMHLHYGQKIGGGISISFGPFSIEMPNATNEQDVNFPF